MITFLTDFGIKDHYVASMKGVILSINPRCTIIDISHEVHPHDIGEGAFLLANAYSFFPKGTIHLAVVDPGVGGSRKSILVTTSDFFFLGPDNGLFTFALQKEKVKHVVALTNRKYFLSEISATFHGRDVFAPVAGYLSLGVKPKDFGNEINSWSRITFQKPRIENGKLVGEVFHIDSFGNLISNIGEKEFFIFSKRRSLKIRIGRHLISCLKKRYGEGKIDEPIALIGSGGFLEISVRDASAQKLLKAKKGDKIEIQMSGSLRAKKTIT